MASSVRALRTRLLEATQVKEERAVASELTQRLDTPSFRAALSDFRDGDGDGINGWSAILKAVVTKLTYAKSSSQPDFVGALSRLVEEAEKSGVRFDCNTAYKLVGHILDSELIQAAPPALAKLYWSILTSLSSEASYFRDVGRDLAQKRCRELADFAWMVLLPSAAAEQPGAAGPGGGGGGSGGATHSMPASAAKLLTRLLLHFPYALPEDALVDLLAKLNALAQARSRLILVAHPSVVHAPRGFTRTRAHARAHAWAPSAVA